MMFENMTSDKGPPAAVVSTPALPDTPSTCMLRSGTLAGAFKHFTQEIFDQNRYNITVKTLRHKSSDG